MAGPTRLGMVQNEKGKSLSADVFERLLKRNTIRRQLGLKPLDIRGLYYRKTGRLNQIDLSESCRSSKL